MDFLQDLKLFSVPPWVKATIVLVLAALGLINTGLFAYGIWNNKHHDGWVKAATDLLGVLLPIFLIALVAWQANTGVRSLRRITEDFFLVILPDVLARTPEIDGPFFEAHKGQHLAEHPSTARILTNLRRGDCDADLLLFLPHGEKFSEILIRIELNIHKINLNLCFDRALFRERHRAETGREASDDPATHGSDKLAAKWLRDVFEHTLGGALHHVDEAERQPPPDGHRAPRNHQTQRLDYRINQVMIDRVVAGRPVVCLVAAIDLAGDFLWDASERLHFAQDLMFFLRSCLRERPDLFRIFTTEQMMAEIDRLRAPAASLA
jgi:hypothetical protein